MITHLTGSVTFPINGIKLAIELSPQPGITAVVGRNGSGKTFSGSELPRYLLFGKKALRGKAADYASLAAKGTFVIAGKTYHIARSAKKEEITDDKGTVLAVGADAVTNKVEELFGYGLEVFDICNASTQKKADLFGQKTAGERKRMIDRVVNLTSTEKVEKLCRDEARGYKREAETLARQLRAPVQPTEPQGYVHSSELDQILVEGRAQRRKADAIAAKIKPVWSPDKPSCLRPTVEQIDDMQKAQDDWQATERRRRELDSALQRCIPYDADDWTEEQLEAAQKRAEARAEIERRGPRPTLTIGEIKAMQDVWAEIAVLRRVNREEVTCPKCDHKFLTGRDVPKEPVFNLTELGREEAAHRAWPDKGPSIPDGPDLTLQQIDRARRARDAKADHDRLRKELDNLPILLDMSTVLDQMRKDKAEWDAYDAALRLADAQHHANIDAEKELRALGQLLSQEYLDALADDVQEAKLYEKAREVYEAEKAEFDRLTALIAEKEELAKEFTRGATALSEARTDVKSFLAPALSRVASSLINDMTMGELSSVVVDEDMEITVNGQRLETLSGAGETVANIALRIALGQVLVSNTFPVFLGDEMDSDADLERRTATADALRNLMDAKRLQQIILITHRTVEIADHVINLSDTG